LRSAAGPAAGAFGRWLEPVVAIATTPAISITATTAATIERLPRRRVRKCN
jgi:hypothetical protein